MCMSITAKKHDGQNPLQKTVDNEIKVHLFYELNAKNLYTPKLYEKIDSRYNNMTGSFTAPMCTRV